MKSVKTKLFLYYSLTITIVLLLISLLSNYFFEENKEKTTLELLDTTNTKIYEFVNSSSKDKIENIDKYIDLKNQFLIIFEDEKLIFTNQSRYKTQNFLEEIEYYDDEDEDFHKNKAHRKEHIEDKYEEFYEDGFIEIADFVFVIDVVQKPNVDYEIYIGVNERILEESIDELYNSILASAIFIYIVLLLVGYILIDRTIKPLRQILEDMKTIQEDEDLSKRLKVLDTKDEFEALVNSFNKMRDNIESSVENIKQFSSDASHELKTPITIIQGEIELAKSKDLNKDEVKELLGKIDKEQKKLQDIISNFLLLSRLDKESIQKSKCMLDSTIFDVIEQNLERIEQKSLELKLDIQEDLEINFSQKYLYIVLDNLVSNAIKYTKEGFIEIKAYNQNTQVIFSIEDSGIGLNKQDQEKIFERFYRVDKARTNFKDGIGLGLAIVKKICTKFNSNIEVNSNENKGSIFKVKFAKITK